MRKVFILVVLFLGGMAAQANEVTHLDHNNTTGIRYNEPQSIHFVQRGVAFTIFPNGSFDFDFINPQVRGRRGYNAPGTMYTNRRNNRYVSYDYYGNVTKVGRNFIYYNRNGQVNQIGNISLRYRNGRLVRVGTMRIFYNRRGHIRYTEGRVIRHHRDGTYYDNNTPYRERNRNNTNEQGGRRL